MGAGVPYAVKDVMDVAPYKTTCGTSFLADK
jgi:Asp-tRNA(Asn)/Glu-tRNA(Gln) amidotransferase A subunit family amidase